MIIPRPIYFIGDLLYRTSVYGRRAEPASIVVAIEDDELFVAIINHEGDVRIGRFNEAYINCYFRRVHGDPAL
jgi:hypothetical protein